MVARGEEQTLLSPCAGGDPAAPVWGVGGLSMNATVGSGNLRIDATVDTDVYDRHDLLARILNQGQCGEARCAAL